MIRFHLQVYHNSQSINSKDIVKSVGKNMFHYSIDYCTIMEDVGRTYTSGGI